MADESRHSISSFRHDPLEEGYRAAEKVERLTDVLSWTAVVVFGIYAYLHGTHNDLQSAAKLVFVLLASASIIAAYYLRYGIQPRMDRERLKLLLTNSFGAKYVPNMGSGYYSSEQAAGCDRLVENLAENTFFYISLLRQEFIAPASLSVLIGIGVAVSLRYGSAEVVELFALLMLFGENGLGRVLRMWWMIRNFEMLHEECLRWIREGSMSIPLADIEAVRLLVEYESIKSRGAVRARDGTFQKLNPRLSAEWEVKRSGLGLSQPRDG